MVPATCAGHVIAIALQLTASFGVAALPESGLERSALIAEADAALYRAKRAGENRVEPARMALA